MVEHALRGGVTYVAVRRPHVRLEHRPDLGELEVAYKDDDAEPSKSGTHPARAAVKRAPVRLAMGRHRGRGALRLRGHDARLERQRLSVVRERERLCLQKQMIFTT